MTDRTVLVTGASGDLGGAVVAAFAADGWRVVAPTRRPASFTVDGPGEVVGVPGTDLTDEAAVAEAVRVAASDPARPLGALVNLAGGFAMGGKVHETSLGAFEAMFTTNLRPTYVMTRAALPALMTAGGGGVVCVSSRAAVAPFAGAAGYASSKAAVAAFAQTVAVEYRDAGVRCNVVLPTVIDTPANRAGQPNADTSKWVRPADLARVIRFLAGPESAPTTGATITI
jgi:NAD(P)-dependent dehydrogenase (short-subunit alcohol dehydrogenase family)